MNGDLPEFEKMFIKKSLSEIECSHFMPRIRYNKNVWFIKDAQIFPYKFGRHFIGYFR